ncbi:MAG: GGDEF domain-containing protein [Clostridiales bacterium]|nr:GGDEF domain-containing protein [Clostridiales bacterium]
MLGILYAEVNAVGGVFLLFMILNKNTRKFSIQPFGQQIFNLLMITNLAILTFDAAMWLIDKQPGDTLRIINLAVSTVYYILNPVMCFLCLIYTDSKVFENKPALIKRMRYYSIPGIISIVLSVMSLFNGWFFTVSRDNVYSRGKLFVVMVVISFVYLLGAVFIVARDIIKNGWSKTKYIDFPIMFFLLLIIGVTLLQILFYGISLIWITSAVACGYVYLNLQNGLISTDYLTKLNNRPRLDIYLERRLRSWQGDTLLFAVMLDLDGFKTINDLYGHISGDEALEVAGKVLRKSCNRDFDFLARMGGDEFIIVGERESIEEIEALIAKIQNNFAEVNRSKVLKFKLEASIGYSLFKKSDDVKSFLDAADGEMYKIKQAKKVKSEQG